MGLVGRHSSFISSAGPQVASGPGLTGTFRLAGECGASLLIIARLAVIASWKAENSEVCALCCPCSMFIASETPKGELAQVGRKPGKSAGARGPGHHKLL